MTFVPGFNLQEAEPILALLASLEEGLDIKPLPAVPLPADWKIVFDSQSVGPFDNRWQLASNTQSGQFAVLVRGTVGQAGSIIDDLLSVMIPANSQIGFQIGGTSVALNYQLA